MKAVHFSLIAPLLLMAACSAPGPKSPQYAPRAPEENVPALQSGPLEEEAIVQEVPSQEPIEPAVTPDPAEVLASIPPDTPPERVASLRLTEEASGLLARGDTPAALDRLEKAIRIDPANPYAYYLLAQMHLRAERFDQAVAFAEKAEVLFGSSNPAWQSQTLALKGSAFEHAGRYPEAREAYRRAVELVRGNVAARAGLARLGSAPPVHSSPPGELLQ